MKDLDNLASMSLEDLEARAAAIAPDEPEVPEPADTPEPVAVPDAEPPAEQEREPEAVGQTPEAPDATKPDWKPDGPGDLKVALQQEREAAKALKAERDHLAQFKAQFDAEQARQQQAAYDAQRYQQLQSALSQTYDPDEQARIVEAMRQQELAYYGQQAQQQQLQAVYAQSWNLAKEAFSDFDAVMQKGLGDPEVSALLEAASMKAYQEGRNPVLAAYKLAQRMTAGPETQEAEIQKRVQAELAKVLQKQQPPANQGHRTIAHISSAAASGIEPDKPFHKMTTEELERRAGVR